MTERIDQRPITDDEFRRVSDSYQAEQSALDARHVRALGGVLGLIHAKTEHLGSARMATLAVAPKAQLHIMRFPYELPSRRSTVLRGR